MNKTKCYRQGDVLIRRVDSLPENRKKLKREKGLVILAHGEVTGHHHSLADEHVDLFSTEAESGVTYLEVRDAMAALTHQEHSTIELPPGKYRVSIQKQYTPAAIQRVAD
jgi:hypothetical protein